MFRYIIRIVKYFAYCSLLFCGVVALVFYTSDHGQLLHFWEMIPPDNYGRVALFLLAFAAVYPLIGYVERKVPLNRPFDLDRDALIEPILHAKYTIIRDQNQQITFRHKSAFTRFMRLYEDAITLDYSDDLVILKGLRRDVYRFSRYMEYTVRQLSRDQE